MISYFSYNLLEGDFFFWYSDAKQWTTQLWEILLKIIKIIDQYSAFSFNIAYCNQKQLVKREVEIRRLMSSENKAVLNAVEGAYLRFAEEDSMFNQIKRYNACFFGKYMLYYKARRYGA